MGYLRWVDSARCMAVELVSSGPALRLPSYPTIRFTTSILKQFPYPSDKNTTKWQAKNTKPPGRREQPPSRCPKTTSRCAKAFPSSSSSSSSPSPSPSTPSPGRLLTADTAPTLPTSFAETSCLHAPATSCQKERGSGQRPELSERRVRKPPEQ